MLIQSIGVPRDNKSGCGLTLNVSLKQVSLVQNRQTKRVNSRTAAQPKSKSGKTNPVSGPAPTQGQARSVSVLSGLPGRRLRMRTMMLVYMAGPFSADDGWEVAGTSTEWEAAARRGRGSVRCPSSRTASAPDGGHRDPGVLARRDIGAHAPRRRGARPARWERSIGTKGEIDEAQRLGMPVFLPCGDEPNYERLLGDQGVTHGRLPDPAKSDSPHFDLSIDLSGREYRLEFKWSVREASWYIRIYTDTDDHPTARSSWSTSRSATGRSTPDALWDPHGDRTPPVGTRSPPGTSPRSGATWAVGWSSSTSRRSDGEPFRTHRTTTDQLDGPRDRGRRSPTGSR